MGSGVVAPWKRPVLAFYRAAWYYDEDVPKSSPCPPLAGEIIFAYVREPNPSDDVVQSFLAVLGRVFSLGGAP